MDPRGQKNALSDAFSKGFSDAANAVGKVAGSVGGVLSRTAASGDAQRWPGPAARSRATPRCSSLSIGRANRASLYPSLS
jgi:phosphate/sulfate permease